MSNGLLRTGIVNEEPPYAEPHVRWCERSETKVGRKLLRFPPTRFLYILHAERNASAFCVNFRDENFNVLMKFDNFIRVGNVFVCQF